jgi:predicted RNase H-like HicB family nuclease
MKRFGLDLNEPQSPFNHRYGFVFWFEDGLWTAKAPAVTGAYGIGVTALEAKDDLVQALETLSEHLKKSAENRKAAVCDRLVATWKTSKPTSRRK